MVKTVMAMAIAMAMVLTDSLIRLVSGKSQCASWVIAS